MGEKNLGQGDTPMVDKSNYHMSTADFRRHGHALIDWIANYLDTVEDKPVSSQVEPGAIRALIPDHPPEEPENFASIMAVSYTHLTLPTNSRV